MAASSSSSFSSSSSLIFGGAEECQSCESGWTTYIASPMKEVVKYGEEHEDIGNEEDNIKTYDNQHGMFIDCKIDKDKDDMDSDDSMASDASSGPVDIAREDHPWMQNEGDDDGKEIMRSDERKMKGVLAKRGNSTKKQIDERKK